MARAILIGIAAICLAMVAVLIAMMFLVEMAARGRALTGFVILLIAGAIAAMVAFFVVDRLQRRGNRPVIRALMEQHNLSRKDAERIVDSGRVNVTEY